VKNPYRGRIEKSQLKPQNLIVGEDFRKIGEIFEK